MLARKVAFGHIIWLTEEEMNCEAVVLEIERLKSTGRVMMFCSGTLEPIAVINKLLQENKELIVL